MSQEFAGRYNAEALMQLKRREVHTKKTSRLKAVMMGG
jgi:hypothetical protein